MVGCATLADGRSGGRRPGGWSTTGFVALKSVDIPNAEALPLSDLAMGQAYGAIFEWMNMHLPA